MCLSLARARAARISSNPSAARQFAAFVIMLQTIVGDIKMFVIVLAVIMLAFVHVLYLRLGSLEPEWYGFHDDGAPNPFASIERTLMSLYLLGFLGDFDADTYQRPLDQVRRFAFCTRRHVSRLDSARRARPLVAFESPDSPHTRARPR